MPEKGLHDLIEAYDLIAANREIEGPAFRLVIAGDAGHETVYSAGLKKICWEKAPEHKAIPLKGDCYFRAGDSRDLAEKIIQKFQAGLSGQTGEGKKENVSLLTRQYNWSKIAPETVALYRTVLRERPKKAVNFFARIKPGSEAGLRND